MSTGFTEAPKSGLLAHAPRQLIERLSEIAKAETFGAGAVVVEQGDPGEAAYFIENGLLEVSVRSSDGKNLALDLLQPGDVVGEIALFDDGPRTATITAKTDARLLRLSRHDLAASLANEPEMVLALLEVAGKRMRWLTQQIHEQAFLSLQERLARKILHLTRQEDGQTNDTLKMAQGELAEFLAVTREAVSKTLTGWKDSGLIDLKRGKLIILDRAELRMMAGFSFF